MSISQQWKKKQQIFNRCAIDGNRISLQCNLLLENTYDALIHLFFNHYAWLVRTLEL
jgi:hypothetical protein